MSFVVAAALAIGLLVVVPIAAHLLRRGRSREQEFPPAALVPPVPPVARQRSRLEDRVLLAVRVLLVGALALLGATPLVRCNRLSLARNAGASVAIALVLDDSLSMRAVVDEQSRFSRALAGAKQLVASAREGDAVSIVLAGRPARLWLAATTDLSAVRAVLDELEPADRATDIEGAIQIARSSLKALPHVDKRVALLSDLCGARVPEGAPRAWAPLEALRRSADDCGIVSAERRGRRVSVELACSSAAPAKNRSLEIVSSESPELKSVDAGPSPKGVVARSKIVPQAGLQSVGIDLGSDVPALEARLVGGADAIEQDDTAPVAPEAFGLGVTVVSDPTSAAVITGGSTLLEQALAALGGEIAVRPLPILPDDLKELDGRALVLIDDPPGMSPEARLTLTSWLERGGVSAALLGPRAATAQLGSTLEPFAQGSVRWEEARAKGAALASVSWLGSEADSLTDLTPHGRARLAGTEPPGAQTVGRWQDGEPLLVEHAVGRGLAVAIGLPSSAAHSDFALRPGFLAILDHLVAEASRRSGPRRSVAGEPWFFGHTTAVEVNGPRGRLPVRESGGTGTESGRHVVPELRGRYRVSVEGRNETRIVTIDEHEILDAPRTLEAAAADSGPATNAMKVDASRELAIAIAALAAIELALRGYARYDKRRRPPRERRRVPASGSPPEGRRPQMTP